MGFRGQAAAAAAPQAPSETSSQKSASSRTNSWGSEYSDGKTEKDSFSVRTSHHHHHHHKHPSKWFGDSRKDEPHGGGHGSSSGGGSHRPSHNRNVSGASTGSAHKDRSHTNVYTHCGRHTDQYLFGGRSVSEMVKSAFKKD